MSGFNRINQIQPVRTTPTVTPLGVRSNNVIIQNRVQQTRQMTPVKRTSPTAITSSTPAKRSAITPSRNPGYVTPGNTTNYGNYHNAPVKKRSIEVEHREGGLGESFTEGVVIESPSILENQNHEYVDDQENEYDVFPSNQLGLYDGEYISQPRPQPSSSKSPQSNEKDDRPAFERVNEETVEMGGFILPGAEKAQSHKSYNWIAGRSDGQYRVVLGYNTLFKQKSKNGIDISTGEKDVTRWRVVRFENRYKEINFPYTEFPAKYLTPIMQALEKARETYDAEMKEEILN
jgi:hypothetical protein